MKRRVRKELRDELLADYKRPGDLTGSEDLPMELAGALVVELTEHWVTTPGHLGASPPATPATARRRRR